MANGEAKRGQRHRLNRLFTIFFDELRRSEPQNEVKSGHRKSPADAPDSLQVIKRTDFMGGRDRGDHGVHGLADKTVARQHGTAAPVEGILDNSRKRVVVLGRRPKDAVGATIGIAQLAHAVGQVFAPEVFVVEGNVLQIKERRQITIEQVRRGNLSQTPIERFVAQETHEEENIFHSAQAFGLSSLENRPSLRLRQGPTHRRGDLFAGPTEWILLRVASRNPDLSAKRLDRGRVDHAAHDGIFEGYEFTIFGRIALEHDVGEAFVIAVFQRRCSAYSNYGIDLLTHDQNNRHE